MAQNGLSQSGRVHRQDRDASLLENPAEGSFDWSLVPKKPKGRPTKRKGIAAPRMEHPSAPPDLAAALEILSLLWYFSRGERKMSSDVGGIPKRLHAA